MSRAPKSLAGEDAALESDGLEGAPHPRDQEHIAGHGEAEKALLDAYLEGRMAQSWILGGRAGIGKATLAWRFARFILANPDPARLRAHPPVSLHVDPGNIAARRMAAMAHSDVFVLRREWNEKSKRHYTEIRVDDARRMIERFHQASAEGGWRVAIIDCAEDMNKSSANALLKLIEEPPPKAVFLFIAHRPAQVMATIRSRSRMLMLHPLSAEDVAQAIQYAAAAPGGEAWAGVSREDLAEAGARAGGSVRDAMRLLSGSGMKLAADVERLLDALPVVDWQQVHGLADRLGGRDEQDDYEAAIAAIFDWLDARVRRDAAGGIARAANLAPLAEVWEKTSRSVRETDALNLDRRLLILTIFNDLAEATRLSA